MRGWTMALGLAAALAGVIAHGAATASTPCFCETVEVTVWRDLADGELYVGAREEGGLWRRDPTALAFSAPSASERFQRSRTVELAVPVTGFGEATVEAVVWRSVADPSRLHLSVRAEGNLWRTRWRTESAPLALRAYGERYERADAVEVVAPFDAPHLTSVTGPLAVFTADAGETWTDADGWSRARDVYVLDTATDRYWRAFAYRHDWQSGVLTAGERLIVRDGRQVRRVELSGFGETVLYEGEGISEVEVSPGGAKVAVMAGDGALTVLNAATGETLLRVDGYVEPDTPLAEIGPPRRSFHLGNWNADGTQIAVTAIYRDYFSWSTDEVHTGLFALDGSVEVLPFNAANVSPDHRYHIIPAEPRSSFSGDLGVWKGFDMNDRETIEGDVTVWAEQGFSIVPYPEPHTDDSGQWRWPVWWAGPNQFTYFVVANDWAGDGYWSSCSELLGAGTVSAATTFIGPDAARCAHTAVAAWEAGDDTAGPGPRILDAATGEIRELDRAGWRRLKARDAASRLSRQGSALIHDGRVIWSGDVHPVGLIELDEPLKLFGVALLNVPRLAVRASAPAREEMVGPLYAWSEAGGYEAGGYAAGERLFHELRRVVVYDAGTGRSWRVVEYGERADVWYAHGGFIVHAGDAVRYVTPDGRARTLLTGADASVRIFRGRAKVIVSIGSNDSADATLALFALPSGEELLRIESTEPRFDALAADVRPYPSFGPPEWPHALMPLGWNADESAFSVTCGDCTRPSGTLTIENEFTALPPDTLSRGFSFLGSSIVARDHDALSSDFRYVVAGKGEPALFPQTWDTINIVEVASGRVLRTVPVRELSGEAIGELGWGWTRDGRFAWSPGDGFDFRRDRIAEDGDDAEVWLLDVESGATERLSAREYAARLPQPTPAPEFPSASVSCPGAADIVQLCAVLLDAEVVGEGRWAEAIGFVALD